MKGKFSIPSGGQRGFTLIEALVVMIVGIVILAAAAAGIGKLFRSSEISTEAGNIMQISTNVRNLRSGASGYSDINTKVAMAYKAIPATMPQDPVEGIVLNTWGGLVFVDSSDGGQAFKISYDKVPADACEQLTLKLRNAGWKHIKVSQEEIMPDSSLSTIAGLCEKEQMLMSFQS